MLLQLVRRTWPTVVSRREMSIYKRLPIDEEGSHRWGELYPHAAGPKQSPIDIVRSKVQKDPMLAEKPLNMNFEGVTTKSITNGGYGWRVDVNSPHTNLTDGPLKHNYRLVQFHSHWGDSCCEGSEHTIDGQTFSGELHLVHYNTDLYKEPGKALSAEKGLSVIGVFLKEGQEHPEFKKICDRIENIKHKESCTNSPVEFDIESLLPNDRSNYWTYEGSLTTPPCFESVTWIVMKEPIELSKEQLSIFRSMLNYKENEIETSPVDGPVLKNWRPCQPVNDRVVREPSL